MKLYTKLEQDLISGFTRNLAREFQKRFKGDVHFDLERHPADDDYFICKVTFISRNYELYCVQLTVKWLDFSVGIPYDLLAEHACTEFKKMILYRYFFKN